MPLPNRGRNQQSQSRKNNRQLGPCIQITSFLLPKIRKTQPQHPTHSQAPQQTKEVKPHHTQYPVEPANRPTSRPLAGLPSNTQPGFALFADVPGAIVGQPSFATIAPTGCPVFNVSLHHIGPNVGVNGLPGGGYRLRFHQLDIRGKTTPHNIATGPRCNSRKPPANYLTIAIPKG